MHLTLCICALIEPCATRTRLVLILHQLEERKPTNTGRLAARCLSNSVVIDRGGAAGTGPTPEALWTTPGSETLLLFPHAEARPLTDWRQAAHPIVLVVLDSTWRQAQKARHRIAGLDRLPCAALPPGGPSSYRLRHAARPDRLATIEAISRALGILEGPESQARLDYLFRVMVDRTLWTNGRLPAHAVTGGIPAGVRSHDPLGIG
jgi:DTW domain-containing protein YfiP